MTGHLKYLVFGVVVLAAYWYTVSRGIVYVAADSTPSRQGPGIHGSGRSGGSFWSTGFHGGK